MGRPKLEQQQTTLSIRISEALRNRLERVKEMISESRGRSVSLSEAAKWYLESAQGERVEAAELLSRPTEALATMYRKWEQTRKLSRADWIVLSHYVQLACEDPIGYPNLPGAQSFATVIEAFLAVWGLRKKSVRDLDHFYVRNLVDSSAEPLRIPDDPVPLDYILKACREILDVLRTPGSKLVPVFVGRILHVALRDESAAGIEAINRGLQPYWDTLWRLAARGHWFREKRPIRPTRPDLILRAAAPVPPVEVEGFRLSVVGTDEGDITMLLEMAPKHICYALSPYPIIREFATMVSDLVPDTPWYGSRFTGFTQGRGSKARFVFRDGSSGIVIDFSEAEWKSLRELFKEALRMSQIQPLLDSLALQYGEG